MSVNDDRHITNPGRSLRERREAQGLTQRQLAALAGCSASSVRFLELGLRSERSEVIERVERVLTTLEQAPPTRCRAAAGR
jgi:transcriptional regulator with XRE-family HTH domain